MHNNSLDLSNRNLYRENWENILSELEANPSTHVLNLSQNNLGLNVSSILYNPEVNNSGDTSTESDNTDLESFFSALSETLKKHDISELYLDNNSLADEGANKIADLLKINDKIKFLGLGNNEISEHGAQSIADAIKLNNTLEHLNLNSNRLADTGTRIIADALKINTGLTHLDLGANSLEYEGVEALKEALKQNKTLRCLNLSRNGIPNRGLDIIAEILEENSNIVALNLSENSIDDEGAEAIAKIISTNRTLTTLILDGNQITPKGLQIISNALEKNLTLTSFEVAENSLFLDDENAETQHIKELILRNKEIANEKDPVKKFAIIKKYLPEYKNFPSLGDISRYKLSTIFHQPEISKFIADSKLSNHNLAGELAKLHREGKLGIVKNDKFSPEPTI